MNDLINTNPLLLGTAPADNGGPTRTWAFDQASPGIDAGQNDGCPSVDQRGYSRPWDGDFDHIATCDIGAFELHELILYFPVLMSQ
jgi:hypothetical protein